MALYAIGDLHLSLGSPKPMDVFGGRWEGYVDKITAEFNKLTDEDVVVVCGDTSWGMTLDESSNDFKFLSDLPGQKILVKGNHDYWWTTASKMEKNFQTLGTTNLKILHNNCRLYGSTAICGTRGWFYEENYSDPQNEKVFRRELGRLESSLVAGKKSGAERLYVFLHYPPLSHEFACDEILGLFEKYGVELCCYGHLHGHAHRRAFEGIRDGVEYRLVSGDYLNFSPLKLI